MTSVMNPHIKETKKGKNSVYQLLSFTLLGIFVAQIFIHLIKDYRRKEYRQVPWRFIAAAVFSILYFLNPFDLILDFIPGLGYIDDAAVMAFVFVSIEYELKKYAKWKGIDLE